MGNRDVAEQLEAAIEEVGKLEREVATLRAEKDSPHADAKYYRELQEARADLAERSRAFEDAAKVANSEISRRMKVEAERDAALAVIAEVRARAHYWEVHSIVRIIDAAKAAA